LAVSQSDKIDDSSKKNKQVSSEMRRFRSLEDMNVTYVMYALEVLLMK